MLRALRNITNVFLAIVVSSDKRFRKELRNASNDHTKIKECHVGHGTCRSKGTCEQTCCRTCCTNRNVATIGAGNALTNPKKPSRTASSNSAEWSGINRLFTICTAHPMILSKQLHKRTDASILSIQHCVIHSIREQDVARPWLLADCTRTIKKISLN